MNFMVHILFGLIALCMIGWSFRQILRIVISCIAIAHQCAPHNRRTAPHIRTRKKHLRFYYLILFAGITLLLTIIFCVA